MDLLDLKDRVVVLTGGCGAIGRIIVKELAAHNARVAVNDILEESDSAPILTTADPSGKRTAYCKANASDPDEVSALFDCVEAHWGLPDVVCCHAGMVDAHPVEQYPIDGFDKIIDVNLRAGPTTQI